jgi:hypothetical protein
MGQPWICNIMNWTKILNFLYTGYFVLVFTRLFIVLQRITQSPPEDREILVGSYFHHDVLSLHHSYPQPSSSPGGHCTSTTQLPLSAHFNPTHASTPHPLQQAAARLVNTVASLRCGRDYICSAGCRVLRVLVPCLQGDKGIKIDSMTADMILATLQKLSLRWISLYIYLKYNLCNVMLPALQQLMLM